MPENTLSPDDIRDPLAEARRVLDTTVPRASPMLKALLASVAFAAAGMWLALSSFISPVLGQDHVAQPTPPVTRTVQAGTEGGFQLSASPDALASNSSKTAH